jgi:hypothetical protein
VLDVEPQEIALVPRGIRFRVSLPDGVARGYICENFGAMFKLPDLGPIGSNGLANPRDFLIPTAAFEDREGAFELVTKFQSHLWRADIGHSPLDVVAWHGNYAPCKYDLRRFNTIGSISYDHPDPSIFLVLHSPSDTPGTSNVDLAIFPPRWLVAQDTFRPPWFHRNVASEFMGLVHGAYDAKAEGFVPGGCSLHNSFTGHGPDAATFEKASAADLSKADVISDTMAFMFETRAVIRPTRQALDSVQRQVDYLSCWQGLRKLSIPHRLHDRPEPAGDKFVRIDVRNATTPVAPSAGSLAARSACPARRRSHGLGRCMRGGWASRKFPHRLPHKYTDVAAPGGGKVGIPAGIEEGVDGTGGRRRRCWCSRPTARAMMPRSPNGASAFRRRWITSRVAADRAGMTQGGLPILEPWTRKLPCPSAHCAR